MLCDFFKISYGCQNRYMADEKNKMILDYLHVDSKYFGVL